MFVFTKRSWQKVLKRAQTHAHWLDGDKGIPEGFQPFVHWLHHQKGLSQTVFFVGRVHQ